MENNSLIRIKEIIDSSKAEHISLLIMKNKNKAYSYFKNCTIQSPFGVASITKPVTATSVIILVDQERISLGDSITKYLPELKQADAEKITIHHLLTHTSGLPEHAPDTIELRKRNASLEDFYNSAQTTPFLFEPGTRYNYSNVGYLLLGVLVEKVSGKPLSQFAQEYIFKPLAMNHTAYGLGNYTLEEIIPSQPDNVRDGHGGAAKDTSWNWNSAYWRNLGSPWGGIISTVEDIAVFMNSFLTPIQHPLFNESAVHMMTTNQLEKFQEYRGVGFSLNVGDFGIQPQAKDIFGHTGSTGTMVWAHLSSQTVFALFSSLPSVFSKKSLLKPISQLSYNCFSKNSLE